MTSFFSVDVFLQFAAMPQPYRVEVTVRDLYYLDRNTERMLGPDGAVIYRLPKPNPGVGRRDLFGMDRFPVPA